MGIAVAIITLMIIRSPFGRRTGAHFNPAITLTYFYLGRVHRWDTLYYVASHFAGGLTGVFVAHQILGWRLSAPPGCYVITIGSIAKTPDQHDTFASATLDANDMNKFLADLRKTSSTEKREAARKSGSREKAWSANNVPRVTDGYGSWLDDDTPSP